ncbi:hypothetical protein [Spirilliplanes yamanashiensis]|uniref:BON domain-containing protein n=1 Tax=Spirilliplanes yamanashiensis TaxID=42233 RepID=A0A8J4DLC7_9ACTN|nr:hypothetical protein [Spirilliplanes yamanashiensis]MDP9816334.1 hypothetical protein [Spirilliplanes yamanashiensis]GIJ05861.1 hypothetical protein Sya03_52130 [Spirilliplanes yamanashiensis]
MTVDEYTEAEIQRVLTEDVDIAEQGITVVRREHALILCGEVESEHRRDEVVRRVRELVPGVPVTCDIGIIRAQAPSEVEELS